MQATKQFPLISGNLSLDLVTTELVRRGQRYDLLITDEEVLDWLPLITVLYKHLSLSTIHSVYISAVSVSL